MQVITRYKLGVSLGTAIQKIADSAGYFYFLDTVDSIQTAEVPPDLKVKVVPAYDILQEYYGDAGKTRKDLLKESRKLNVKIANLFVDLHLQIPYLNRRIDSIEVEEKLEAAFKEIYANRKMLLTKDNLYYILDSVLNPYGVHVVEGNTYKIATVALQQDAIYPVALVINNELDKYLTDGFSSNNLYKLDNFIDTVGNAIDKLEEL